MEPTITPLAAAAALAAASLALARAKLNASAVGVHYLGDHNQGFDNPKHTRFMAEAIGMTTLSTTADAYKETHGKHHPYDTFATLADPDARLMWDLGFRPGMDCAKLKRHFWLTLISPRLHGPMTWARLKLNFGADQPTWRRLMAWGWWGSLVAAAAAGGWLAALLLGLVTPLLVGGNITSFVELASEHKWLLRYPEGGAERQFALSHGRNPLPPPPDEGAPWWQWLAWVVRLLMAALSKVLFLPEDQSRHEGHHIWQQAELKLAKHGWTNAALEYSPRLYRDPKLAAQRYGSVLEAVYAWLEALSKEPPMKV